MRGMYKTFAANCRFTSAASAPHIRFMAACVVETYGLDHQLAYQLAFGYIRQLAVLLRNALTVKTQVRGAGVAVACVLVLLPLANAGEHSGGGWLEGHCRALLRSSR